MNAIGDSDDEDFGVTKKRRRQVISDDESDEDEGVENEVEEDEEMLLCFVLPVGNHGHPLRLGTNCVCGQKTNFT